MPASPTRLSSSTVSRVAAPSPPARTPGLRMKRSAAASPARRRTSRASRYASSASAPAHGNLERIGGGREHADVNALETTCAVAVRHGRDHRESGARRQGRFDIDHQIGHLATAPVEERRPLRLAHHVGEPRRRHARGHHVGGAVALEQLARLRLQPVGVDACGLGGVTRGVRETEGEERLRPAVERRRGELGMVALLAGQPRQAPPGPLPRGHSRAPDRSRDSPRSRAPQGAPGRACADDGSPNALRDR